MTDPSPNIGNVLRRIRFERGLTLGDTSDLTGVSKAMLGQIERGESNPTVSILWKISNGLKISFSELLSGETDKFKPISLEDIEPVYESDKKMILYDIFPFNPISGFEYFYIKLLPGAEHISTPHTSSTEEHIMVTKGTLELSVGNQMFSLRAPSAIKFNAGEEHSYSNPYDEEVIFQNIIKY